MNEYNQQALDFLRDSETQMAITKIGTVDGFPFDPKDTYHHDKYIVVLTRNGKSYDFKFYDSAKNYIDNLNRKYCGQREVKPSAYDVLACLEKYPVEPDVWDFAAEFGYEINDKESYERVCKIHADCLDQYKHLLDLFGEDWMEKLAEIN